MIILNQREDLTSTQIQQIGARLDSVRQQLLQQARANLDQLVDTLQQDLQNRTESLKQKTLEQLEETCKAIATAIWWLFALAFSSILTSAFAEIIAVEGINFSFVTNFWSQFS